MKCPKCDQGSLNKKTVANDSQRSTTRRVECDRCSHKFTTVERIVYRVERPVKQRPRQDRGVRFDVRIGDDEPGRIKP